MTFDDILASRDLIDGVWDTQRFAQTMDASVSAATQKKLNGHSRTVACCFRSHPTRPHVTSINAPAKIQSSPRSSKGRRPNGSGSCSWRPMNPMASITSDSTTGDRCASGYSTNKPSTSRPSSRAKGAVEGRGTGPPNHPDRIGGLHVPPINAGLALK